MSSGPMSWSSPTYPPNEMSYYDTSKMGRMEYSRMMSPTNQNALNSGGGYYLNGRGNVGGQAMMGGMMRSNMAVVERGVPYSSQFFLLNLSLYKLQLPLMDVRAVISIKPSIHS
ncbi:hypothetical protein HELRODRAFT_164611 [Helobdella robusta]|uniref:Uncharacterized protein n=1 Tax=Helobdella robusta TaxID=6412 RepID=T1EVM9_HELRO|nr:hypothetical protein HELRODRAFT_164611 [Helobdella robusta]ESN94722.1 hypothetical protein HELRODRAFT_164611 [Helobdella robusta]